MLEREEISNPLMALVKKTFIHRSIRQPLEAAAAAAEREEMPPE